MSWTAMTWLAQITPEEAQEKARKILEEDRFRGDGGPPPGRAPQPFKAPLSWLGDQLRKVFEPLGRLFARIGNGGPIGWILLVGLIGVLVVIIAKWWARRTVNSKKDSTKKVKLSKRIAELEQAAKDAAEAGRYAEAIRLRFQAGLLRLEDDGRVTKVERKPNADVVAAVPAQSLRPLANLHDRLAYSEDDASKDDLDRAVVAIDSVIAEAANAPDSDRSTASSGRSRR
jgi:hypothetical protein